MVGDVTVYSFIYRASLSLEYKSGLLVSTDFFSMNTALAIPILFFFFYVVIS